MRLTIPLVGCAWLGQRVFVVELTAQRVKFTRSGVALTRGNLFYWESPFFVTPPIIFTGQALCGPLKNLRAPIVICGGYLVSKCK